MSASTSSAAPRAELLHVLMLLDLERATDRRLLAYRQSRTFAELLLDLEEDRTTRALVIGMPREGRERGFAAEE